VAGVGTSGTLQGTALFLKERNPRIKVVEVQPENEFHGIEGLKYMAAALRPPIYREDVADGRYFIKTEEAVEMTRTLRLLAGVPAGVSGGAALAAALKLSDEIDEGVVVVILPDGISNHLEEKLVSP
ncbi:MAG: pyridoxal-phosphate dependent enzyme, partial [Candidatus Caldarchaeum sp.]